MKKVAIVINSLKNGGAEKQAVVLAKIFACRCKVKIIVLRPTEGMSDKLLIQIAETDIDVISLGKCEHLEGIRGLCSVFKEWKLRCRNIGIPQSLPYSTDSTYPRRYRSYQIGISKVT